MGTVWVWVGGGDLYGSFVACLSSLLFAAVKVVVMHVRLGISVWGLRCACVYRRRSVCQLPTYQSCGFGSQAGVSDTVQNDTELEQRVIKRGTKIPLENF